MSEYDSTTHLPEASQAIATAFLGPFYVGCCLNFVLYGVLVSNMSAYILTRNYKRDSRFNQIFIWTVVALDTLATGVNVFTAYYHGVNQDRTSKSVLMTHPVDALTPMLIGTLGVVVEVYLLLRASKIFHHRRLWRSLFLSSGGFIIFVGWLASIGAGVANFAFTWNFSDSLLPLTYNMLAGIWLWCSAGTDLVITVCLIVGMRRAIHGFNEDTDNAIRRIMKQAMLTASWTALFGALGALCSVVFPPTDNDTLDIVFAFSIPLTSLYALSVLTTLSSRKPIRRTMALATPKVTQISPEPGTPDSITLAEDATTIPPSSSSSLPKKESLLKMGPIHRSLQKLIPHPSSDSTHSHSHSHPNQHYGMGSYSRGHSRSSSRGSISSSKGGITVTREVQSEVDIDRSVLPLGDRGRRARFEQERDASRERSFAAMGGGEREDSPSGKGVLDEQV